MALETGNVHTYSQNTWSWSDVVAGPDDNFYLAYKNDQTSIAVVKWNGTSWADYASFSIADTPTADTGFSDDLDMAITPDGHVHIVFRHTNQVGLDFNAPRGVSYGEFDGTSWNFSVVDEASDPNGWKNYNDPSLVVDADGHAHIAYLYSDVNGNGAYDVRYATNESGSWAITKPASWVGNGVQSRGVNELHDPSLTIGPDGKITLTYVFEDNQNDVYGNVYAMEKPDGGSWSAAAKIFDGISAGYTPYYDLGGADSQGRPHLIYADADGSLHDLTNASGSWQTTQILPASANADYATDYQQVGGTQYMLVTDTAGDTWFYYNSGGGWLKGNQAITGDSDLDFAVNSSGVGMVITLDNGAEQLRDINYATGDTGAPTNSAPTVTGLPAGIAITEDTPGNLDISSSSFGDLDGDQITVTLSVSAGTIALSNTGGISVTLAGQGTSTVTVTGAAADVNLYFDQPTNTIYTPAANANGTGAATLTVSADDGSGSVALGTVPINIAAVNDAPVIDTPASITVTEDVSSPLTGISFADIDAGSNWVHVTISSGSGSLTVNASAGVAVGGGSMPGEVGMSGTIDNINALFAGGGVKYTSALNSNADDTFTITIDDAGNSGSGGVLSHSVNVTLQVTPVNDDPVVSGPVALAASEEDAPRTITTAQLIANTSDVDNDTLSVANLSASAGTLVDNGDGTWGYQPAPNDDTGVIFTYDVVDGKGGSVSTTATFDLLPVNDRPEVYATGFYWVTEDVASPLSEISFVDVDAGNGQVEAMFSVGSGTFAATSSGDVAVALMDGGTWLTLQGTIDDINAFLAGGNLTYTTAQDAISPQSVSISLDDKGNTGFGLPQIGFGSQLLFVTPVNDDPVVSGPVALVPPLDEDSTRTITTAELTARASDVDNDALSVANLSVNAGTLVDNGDGTWTYTPAPDDDTNVAFSYDVVDGNGGSVPAFATLDLLPLNDAPAIATAGSIAVTEDVASPLTGISFSDVDAGSGDVLVALTVPSGTLAATSGGSVAVSGSEQILLLSGTVGAINAFIVGGNVTYTTAVNASGTVALGVEINDLGHTGLGPSHTVDASIDLTITPVNDAPVLAAPLADVSFAEDSAVSFALPAGSFSDVDGDSLTYAATLDDGSPLPDWLSFDAGTQTFSGTPPQDFNGALGIEVTASDGEFSASDAFSLTITAENDAPVITSDGGGATASVSVAENGTSVTTVVASDIDSPAPTYAIGGGADAALFAIDAATGKLAFVTAPDHEAPADADGDNVYEVVVQAADDGGLFAEQALAVTVTNVNEAPTGLSAALSVSEGAANGTVVGTLSATDPEGDSLTYTLIDDAGGRFVLDGDEIKVAQGWLLDYEQAPSHMIRVGVSDGAFSLEKEFTVAVGDVSPENFTTGPGGGTLEGGGEGDFVTGNIGPDHLSGGGGNDFVTGGGGGDTMDGGDGFDSVSWFSAPEGVVLDLADQANNGGAATGDTVADFEVYYLSAHDDTVAAGDDGVYLYGFGGDDTLTGGAGSDFIDGGAGADTIDGGDGFDYASWYTATSGVTVNLQDPSKNTGDAEGDTLANVEAFYLTAHDDVFVGQDGQNIVFGQEGDDDLTGGAVSNDWLFGGAGDDRLTGGVLDDLLSGGDGKDTYVFLDPASNGFDQVLDFVSGEDAIELSAEGFGLAAGTAFTAGASFIASENPLAVTGEATLLYATGLGILYYDPDGNGAHAAYALAQFAAAPTLEASDFYVV